MSRAVSLAAAWILLIGLSSSFLATDAGEKELIATSPKVPSSAITTTDEESIPAQRIRLDRAFEDSIRKRLLQRVTLKFNDRELQHVLSQLAKDHDLPIAFDLATLADEGVALDQTLSLDVQDITLRSALRLILNPLQLTSILQDETLIVTTAVKAGETLTIRVYDVDRLLVDNDYTELREVVTSCVEPSDWDEVGGPCSARELDKTRSLVVRATQNVHEDLASLLADLHAVIHSDEVKPVANPIRERERSIRQKLVDVCSIDCDGVPLDRVLSDFAARNKLPLWTDRATLADEGIPCDKAVTARLKDVRIESALNHLLGPLNLTWIIEDEVLKVTSMVKAGEHLVAFVYDVRDIAKKFEPTWPPRQLKVSPSDRGSGIGGGYASNRSWPFGQEIAAGAPMSPQARFLLGGYDHTELIELFTSTIEPDAWDEVGGPGSIRGFHQALVVRQTGEIHDQIKILLQNLRTDLRRQREREAVKPSDPQELQRVVYDFVAPYEYSPAELAKLIPESIDPETWKGAGGNATLIVQPTSLVITQTSAVHKDIVKLLYEVVLHHPIK